MQPRPPSTDAPLTVRLAEPRGFCAGVDRAIRIVEEALAARGAPVYVRHEIVHNAHVVERLRAMGAVFVDDVADAPSDRPIVFSAHGAPKSAYDAATARGMDPIDATCPLVLKIHNEARRHVRDGRHVLLIGHAGHPEIVGVMGQVPDGAASLVETPADAEAVSPPQGPLAYATQTTLSVDDAAEIIATLTRRFPDIAAPRTADICYATTNRQCAVKAAAAGCDAFFVVGDPTSSNSKRLVETAARAGADRAALIDDPAAFDAREVDGAAVIGVSAGASAPEDLVEAFVARLAASRAIRIERVCVAEERVTFKSPPIAALAR
ncbi:MAG: 4-hydroxy-3-methylbut-2-enyl diphosphate reductase [Parvularculaceae bacterium]